MSRTVNWKNRSAFTEQGASSLDELYPEEGGEAVGEYKLAVVENAKAVFFSGRVQLGITSLIGDTQIYDQIHEIYRCGGIIAGASAGASAMIETMLARGPNASFFRIGELCMAPGLGLLPDVIINQQVAERGRSTRGSLR